MGIWGQCGPVTLSRHGAGQCRTERYPSAFLKWLLLRGLPSA